MTAVCAVCAVLICCAWLPMPLISALTAPEMLVVPLESTPCVCLIGVRQSVGVVAGAARIALHGEDVARGGGAADRDLPAVEADVAAGGIGKTARTVDRIRGRASGTLIVVVLSKFGFAALMTVPAADRGAARVGIGGGCLYGTGRGNAPTGLVRATLKVPAACAVGWIRNCRPPRELPIGRWISRRPSAGFAAVPAPLSGTLAPVRGIGQRVGAAVVGKNVVVRGKRPDIGNADARPWLHRCSWRTPSPAVHPRKTEFAPNWPLKSRPEPCCELALWARRWRFGPID